MPILYRTISASTSLKGQEASRFMEESNTKRKLANKKMTFPEPEMNAEQENANQSVNENYSTNKYPADNPVAQTVQNGERASDKDTENVSEISSAK